MSCSNISLIERGERSPTATVLDRLAVALGVNLSSLFEESSEAAARPSPMARAADHPVWTDPVSGYVRRNLSPAAVSPIQFVEVSFPAGQRVAYETGTYEEARMSGTATILRLEWVNSRHATRAPRQRHSAFPA